MRGFIVMAMFVASLAQADSKGYTEVRDLALESAGLAEFVIDAGAGSLVVTGVDGARDITVTATIVIEDKNEEAAQKLIAKRLDLKLERDGDRAKLESGFKSGWGWDANARIDLDIRMPAGLALQVDDGSGSTTITGVTADMLVDDGSGSVQVTTAGSVTVDDGSGSITVSDASGDVDINDGSGSIDIRRVGGSVKIDDGSGSIKVDDVENDLIIVDDGSGSVTYTNVRGAVELND
ncbi:MAG: hypothetical protein ACR2QX_15525 [Woeseiaceae bacterium]